MIRSFQPTNGQNAVARLFFRFFAVWVLSLLIAFPLAARGVLLITPGQIAPISFALIPLALLGGLLTVTKPYLLLLCAAKACFDISVLYRVTQDSQNGLIGMLHWNGCFFLVVFSLLLFATAAANAEFFSFLCEKRNVKLLLSRQFLRYFLLATVLTVLALCLLYLWPQLLSAMGLSLD